MAGTSSRRTCALLVVLILAGEALSSEARTFGGDTNKLCKECQLQVERHVKGSMMQSLAHDKSMVTLDDTRPSTPGHSPGVGHVLQTNSGSNDK